MTAAIANTLTETAKLNPSDYVGFDMVMANDLPLPAVGAGATTREACYDIMILRQQHGQFHGADLRCNCSQRIPKKRSVNSYCSL